MATLIIGFGAETGVTGLHAKEHQSRVAPGTHRVWMSEHKPKTRAIPQTEVQGPALYCPRFFSNDLFAINM